MAHVILYWEIAASCLFHCVAMACHESTTNPWQVNLIRGIFVCLWVCVQSGGLGWKRESEAEEVPFRQMFIISVVQANHNVDLWAMPRWRDCSSVDTLCVRRCQAPVCVDLQPRKHGARGLDVRADTLTPGLAWWCSVCANLSSLTHLFVICCSTVCIFVSTYTEHMQQNTEQLNNSITWNLFNFNGAS